MEKKTILRDFIETKDNLFFSVVAYHHPSDRITAYLRYFPHVEGDRERNGIRYKKIESTQQSFDFLKSNFPEYIYRDEMAGRELQCVPGGLIRKILFPRDRLREIIHYPKTLLEKKVAELHDALKSVPQEKKGITGSILPGLETDSSDIDFIIVGSENHRKARMELKKIFQKNGNDIRPLNKEEWKKAYEKRFPGKKTIPFSEFLWQEERKYHKGIIHGTILDLLLVKDWDEVGNNNRLGFHKMGTVNVSCTVTDSSLSFDYPSLYKVECRDFPEIKEVVSFTHTYAGQALDGEKIFVSGCLEEVITINGKYNRILVGTTREAEDEYIRLEDIHRAALP